MQRIVADPSFLSASIDGTCDCTGGDGGYDIPDALERNAMKFFVPHASDDEQAATVWDSVRAHLLTHGMPTEERKIWKLNFRHNGKSYAEEVGKLNGDLREDVIIILRAKGQPLYYVCTANRGVARGEPYLVGIDHDTFSVDFG